MRLTGRERVAQKETPYHEMFLFIYSTMETIIPAFFCLIPKLLR